jgi:acetylornithine/N-succinyldiaminopimelate aminotransferase
MKNRDVAKLTDRYVVHTYARYPIALVRGKGARVWDADGKEYLDFLAGIAVNALGHCHPAVVGAIRTQSRKLLHVSNLYHILPQAELARELCRHSFADRVFFCNSGAEANEAAFKLARRYGSEHLGGKYEILSAHNSFHGRTLATLTATGQEKVRAGYDPLPSGFRQIPFNDLRAAEDAVDEQRTVAILIEPIQGEGGVNVVDEHYLRGLRELCDRRGLLLILDEVQTGMGRTGKLFGYENFGVAPDIMTLAKALGGGLPLGAMLAREDVAKSFVPGSHASTFGGNPLVCSVGLAVMKTLLKDGVLKNCAKMGKLFVQGLDQLKSRFSSVRTIRGKGLLLGLELEMEGAKIVEECMTEGLLLNCTAYKVLRFAPPLTITEKEISRGLGILEKVLARQ